jgi:steroid 5-alpha reductase family enzyme|tara:strand:- start:2302 stop:3162 length:861 start_codon:yes stop_codon:yes gene_type:complete
VSNKASGFGILLGLALAVAIALSGASGAWTQYDTPPILVAAAVAILVQWAAFVFAWRRQSEHFFDLTGSATFISVVLIAAFLSRAALGPLDIALGAAVIAWALRLGAFLVSRVRSVGSDKRFEAIKPKFLWFLMTWTLQGVWVVATASVALAVVGDGQAQSIGVVELVGLLLWLAGLGIEVVADEQKRRFRQQGAVTFITTGLWSKSRHPNYFGEMLLWSGLALAACPSLIGWQLVTMVSPVFVWALLIKISGAPMLEAKADRRFGNDPEYVAYKKATPLLIPRLW